MPPRARQTTGDGGLRSLPALGFPDVPAVFRRHELGAHASPAGAAVEEDVMVIDQVFAARGGSGFQGTDSIGDFCTRISNTAFFSATAVGIANRSMLSTSLAPKRAVGS